MVIIGQHADHCNSIRKSECLVEFTLELQTTCYVQETEFTTGKSLMRANTTEVSRSCLG